ncbi:MAG TPA: hypothetical protein GXX36_04050 [Clostridiaceae bacterium]|nr:hypothetical protein [Clostridiaceae bacterium]
MLSRFFKIILISPLLIICLLGGCGNNQFDKEYNKFKESYLKVTEVLDIKEPLSSIENLNKDHISKEIDEIKNIVLKLNSEASSKIEKRICNNVSMYLEGLEFLQYAAKNKDKLSEDERGRIVTELTLMQMYRNDIKSG